MTMPLITLLAACLLPFVWLPFAIQEKAKMEGGLDNKNPRAQSSKLTGRGARALGAHQNAFEALPMVTAGLLAATSAGVDSGTLNILCGAWIVARVLHGVFYLADIDKARSGAFAIGFFSVLGMIGMGFVSGGAGV